MKDTDLKTQSISFEPHDFSRGSMSEPIQEISSEKINGEDIENNVV